MSKDSERQAYRDLGVPEERIDDVIELEEARKRNRRIIEECGRTPTISKIVRQIAYEIFFGQQRVETR